MSQGTPPDDLDSAFYEFIKTFKAFERAAKDLMRIMDRINEQKNRELQDVFGKSRQIHDFLIQITDGSGRLVEKSFGLKCVIETGEEPSASLEKKG